ncbi:DUF397 domain-containing protein [Nocardia sp. NPDC003693]
MSSQPPVRQWYKSSRSSNAADCVEVYQDGDRVGVRDSKDPGGPEVWFPGGDWDTFLDSHIWKS